MKYIVLKVRIGQDYREMPFVFPNIMVHADAADAMMSVLGINHGWESEVIAAGEVSFFSGGPNCGGESTTLKVKSRWAKDDQLLRMHDYSHGIIL